jgi:hypothetical protein
MKSIIEKIKKLLRIKRGGTPDEIATALSLAQELARKHNLDIGNINPDEKADSGRITHDEALQSSRIQWEHKYAAAICERFFNVTVVYSNLVPRRKRVTFIGNRADIEISFYVFNYLAAHFRRRYAGAKNVRNRQAFLYGMYIGLGAKLETQRQKSEPTAGLILFDAALVKREKYTDEIFGPTRAVSHAPKGNAEVSTRLGAIEGLKTEIRSGLAASRVPEGNLLTA